MQYASPHDTPKAADVILKRTNDASRRCTLSTSGEAPQIVCATADEAIAQADRFARTHHVDVWQTDDGRTFTRILEARLASSM